MRATQTAGLVIAGLHFTIGGCDEALQSPLVPPADFMAPAPVVDLAVSAAGLTSVALTWTAPRARSESGRVTRYEILYSTGDPDSTDWNQV